MAAQQGIPTSTRPAGGTLSDDAVSVGPGAPVARWPLELGDPTPAWLAGDAWAAIVWRSIDHYRLGLPQDAARYWSPSIVWRVPGTTGIAGIHRGAAGIFDYHAMLARLTNGTFRQTLVAIEGGGPIVSAYVRTRARRSSRTIEIPSLISFEVADARVMRVTELPGDLPAWDAFWS